MLYIIFIHIDDKNIISCTCICINTYNNFWKPKLNINIVFSGFEISLLGVLLLKTSTAAILDQVSVKNT